MSREILTRSRLLEIIDQFNLYSNERRDGATAEALASLLHKHITVEPLDSQRFGPVTAFRVAFTTELPDLAQQVTARITQIFIDENMRARETKAERTTDFLKDQADAAKKALAEQEQRLQTFKSQYLGELPEQQQVNMLVISDLRGQLQTTQSQLSRAKQYRTDLESNLRVLLSRLQTERAALTTRYTPRHPEVVKKDQEIARAEAAINQAKTGFVAGDSGQQNLLPPDDLAFTEVLRQVESNRREIDTLSREQSRLTSDIARYQGRLRLTPVREQQMNALLRDYESSKRDYSDLQSKQIQSQLATAVEERGDGARFRLIDPPTLPLPASSKRIKVSLGALGAGVFLGAALVVLKKLLDGSSFHSEKEVRGLFSVPLVVGVPILSTPEDIRRKKWGTTVQWILASIMILLVVGAEYLVYRSS